MDNMLLVYFIEAVSAVQKLNNLSKKFSMKQVAALKEMSSCLPEKSFKKSTSKLIDRCKQVNHSVELCFVFSVSVLTGQ